MVCIQEVSLYGLSVGSQFVCGLSVGSQFVCGLYKGGQFVCGRVHRYPIMGLYTEVILSVLC